MENMDAKEKQQTPKPLITVKTGDRWASAGGKAVKISNKRISETEGPSGRTEDPSVGLQVPTPQDLSVPQIATGSVEMRKRRRNASGGFDFDFCSIFRLVCYGNGVGLAQPNKKTNTALGKNGKFPAEGDSLPFPYTSLAYFFRL